MGDGISTLSFQMESQTFQIPDLQGSMTVYSLKKSIHAHSGVCIMEQTLFYKKTKLEDHRRLSSYNIREGDTIVVEVGAQVAHELTIESNSGTRLAVVAYNPDNTVANVKQLIQAKTSKINYTMYNNVVNVIYVKINPWWILNFTSLWHTLGFF